MHPPRPGILFKVAQLANHNRHKDDHQCQKDVNHRRDFNVGRVTTPAPFVIPMATPRNPTVPLAQTTHQIVPPLVAIRDTADW